MFAGIKLLSDRYAKMYGITKKEAEKRLKQIQEVVREELLEDNTEGIQIIDFITLKKVVRAPKLGRNPKDPTQTFQIPETVSIKCELGVSFKEQLRSKTEKK